MEKLAAITLVLGFFFALPAFAEMTGPDMKYTPEERFKVPVNKSTGLSGATNVVIKEVRFDELPEFVQKQAEVIARECTFEASNRKLMKFYRYTSDMTRDNGLFPNYFVDLAGLIGKPQRQCIVGRACADGECHLVGYNSTAPNQWGQHFVIQQKDWSSKQVEEQASKTPLTIFSLESRLICADRGKDKEDDDSDRSCTAEYIWLGNGLVQFTQPPPGDAPAAAEEARPRTETQGGGK